MEILQAFGLCRACYMYQWRDARARGVPVVEGRPRPRWLTHPRPMACRVCLRPGRIHGAYRCRPCYWRLYGWRRRHPGQPSPLAWPGAEV